MYQFIHIEKYARAIHKQKKSKWTARQVADEADRLDKRACRHVKNPQPPSVVFDAGGYKRVGDLVTAIENLTALERNEVKGKNGKKYIRKVRADKPILIAGVSTFPAHGDLAKYEEWKARTIDFLRAEFGEHLRLVIEHLDEEHPHFHFYVSHVEKPSLTNTVHPGFVAGDSKDSAEAMRNFQRRYHEKVGAFVGMAHHGPRKRRLSRSAWKAEQEQNESVARVLNENEQVKEKNEILKEILNEVGIFDTEPTPRPTNQPPTRSIKK